MSQGCLHLGWLYTWMQCELGLLASGAGCTHGCNVSQGCLHLGWLYTWMQCESGLLASGLAVHMDAM